MVPRDRIELPTRGFSEITAGYPTFLEIKQLVEII
jgi:hypothetical protein